MDNIFEERIENWREKRKLDGNQSSIYGNGLIIESKTNCY